MKKFSEALNTINSEIPGKELAGQVIDAAVSDADPLGAVRSNLKLEKECLTVGGRDYQLQPDSKVILVALGKAAPAMSSAALQVLGQQLASGVCICKHLDEQFINDPRITAIIGNHPVPGEGSLQAGKAIQKVISGLSIDDVVVLLLSGGGSALATLPAAGIGLADMQVLTGVLLRSGATINEINTVRKHLDLIKGGGLLRLAAPAKIASLVLSDVVGNPLDVIASGPAVADPTTFLQALEIVQRAGKYGKIPDSILEHLESGASGLTPETVKPGDGETRLVQNSIIGSNQASCAAALEKAVSLGFHAEILTTSLTGEAREAGETLARIARERQNLARPFVLISGGETTVTIKGGGKGGRNLEVALSAVSKFTGLKGVYLVTCATDGEDGPTDAAGAVVDGTSLNRALALGLSPEAYLESNNSYGFFEALGDILVTGPTGTNVNDISFIFGF